MSKHTNNPALRRIRQELAGRCFTTAKELRHIAEGAGFNFVPIEVVHAGEREAHMVLHPSGVGEVHVRATRAQGWHPFYIHTVEVVSG
jgi:hypothetical protein